LIGAPTGATIFSVTGVFEWTATTAGSYSFKVRVTDNSPQKSYDEEKITVTVTNSLQGDAVSIETIPAKLADATLVPTLENSIAPFNSDNFIQHNTTGAQVLVYPTIVQNSANISVMKKDENVRTMNVTVADRTGKIVMRKEKIDFQPQQVSLPHLSSGMYLMLIEFGGYNYSQKIIVSQ